MTLLLFLVAAAVAQAPQATAPTATYSKYISSEMDSYLMAGIDDIYRMRFDEAEQNARKAISIDPEEPHAYLGLAGISWTRYVYETDQGDERYEAEYEKRAAQA